MDETTTPAPEKNNSMMIIGIIIVLAIVGIGVYMMMNKSQSSQTTETTMEEGQPAQDEAMIAEESTTDSSTESSAAAEDSTVKTFEIEAGSFYYKPNEIRVKKGDKVKIVMNSVDMMHDFNIDELNLVIPITKSGETNTVEFTVDTAGEFEFYCSVGQHRANGQVGTLIVEE